MQWSRYPDWRFLWLLCIVFSVSCQPESSYRKLTGTTMGTSYHVQFACRNSQRINQYSIDELLIGVNDLMSTYQVESVLSRFNRSEPGAWFDVPQPLVEVVAAAQHLSEISDGIFDVTVGPLVNLWGFGPEMEPAHKPTDAAIAAAKARVGYHYLDYRMKPPGLRKERAVYVDLSSIAKGYGVDVVADWLESRACSDYLVEIGGEVRARGVNPQHSPWRLGIEVPDPGSLGGVQKVIAVSDTAVATSGDYRNFARYDGRRYSHTIDPRTGYPVTHNLASVTVLHPSAMWADGFATLLEAAGPERGYEIAISNGLPAVFIERADTGFTERETPEFKLLKSNI